MTECGRRLLALAAAALLPAASVPDAPAWTRDAAPFHVVGPVWYVGSEGIAAYLIRTPAGAILIDGTMRENAAMVARHIRQVGVRPRDVRWLLVSHAHFDHVGADAALVRATGARVAAGAGDVAALESGRPPGETLYPPVRFAPVQVARAVRDGDRVTLGGTTLVAHATPGHTPGCITWSMRVAVAGTPREVVFACSLTAGGNRLVGNRRYPGIVADFRRSVATLAAMPADVVLPMHPEIADVAGHHARAEREGERAWIDPTLLRRIATDARPAFEAELARQKGA